MRATVAVRLLLACVIPAMFACRDSATPVCPLVLYVKPTAPRTVTLSVGGTTLATAGTTQGACDDGPPPADFLWTVADSTIASAVPLDSIHARIQALRPGLTTVTAAYRSSGRGPGGVEVTVVP